VHHVNGADLNAFLFAWTSSVDTSKQRRGHLIAILVAAAIILVAPLFRKAALSQVFSSSKVVTVRVLAVMLGVFFVSSYLWWWQEVIEGSGWVTSNGLVLTSAYVPKPLQLFLLCQRNLKLEKPAPLYHFSTSALGR
jgi:hypothetical protein